MAAQVAVEPLGTFREAWRPDEPARLAPVHVERVSLRDALAARRGLSVQSVLGAIELVEPTFQVRLHPSIVFFVLAHCILL